MSFFLFYLVVSVFSFPLILLPLFSTRVLPCSHWCRKACLYFPMRALESQLRSSCLAIRKAFSAIWAIFPVPSSLLFLGGVPCIIGNRLASSSVCIQGWPGSSDQPASTSQVPGVQAWTTIPHLVLRIKLAFMHRALWTLGKHSTFSAIYPAPGDLVLTVGVNYILWLWILCI